MCGYLVMILFLLLSCCWNEITDWVQRRGGVILTNISSKCALNNAVLKSLATWCSCFCSFFVQEDAAFKYAFNARNRNLIWLNDLIVGLHWCHDAWLWSRLKAMLWAQGFHEASQFLIHRRFQRVFSIIAFPIILKLSRFKGYRFLKGLCFSSLSPGFLFSTSQLTQTLSGDSKKRSGRGKLLRKACSLTEIGPAMDL